MTNANTGKHSQKAYESEQIHTITITPSLKQAALKEGFPLYGTGRLDPLKPSAEIGIRNRNFENLNFRNKEGEFIVNSPMFIH